LWFDLTLKNTASANQSLAVAINVDKTGSIFSRHIFSKDYHIRIFIGRIFIDKGCRYRNPSKSLPETVFCLRNIFPHRLSKLIQLSNLNPNISSATGYNNFVSRLPRHAEGRKEAMESKAKGSGRTAQFNIGANEKTRIIL
jgi:hypothetical protein